MTAVPRSPSSRSRGRSPLRCCVAIVASFAVVGGACGGDEPAVTGPGEQFVPLPPESTTSTTTTSTTAVTSALTVIRPTSIVASATAPSGVDAAGTRTSYDAALAIDGNPTTAWRAPGDARGVTLTLQLPAGTVVTEIGLLPGFAKVDPADGSDRFVQNRRVRAARYRLSGTAGETAFDARFADERRVQFTPVGRTPATTIVIEIVESSANPVRDFTAVSEIEVRGSATSS